MPLQRGPRLENNVRAANVVPEGTIGLTHFRSFPRKLHRHFGARPQAASFARARNDGVALSRGTDG